jgi:hypothetical protein
MAREAGMRCSMTGQLLRDSSEGIYDDGEWVSWDYINGYLADQELKEEFPKADLEVVKIFHDLIDSAQAYRQITGRYLQIWGELGELYGEIKYGIVRHKACTPGSDGRCGNDWIEVKTISPEKGNDITEVKRCGNFNKLLVVKISLDFEFQARLIPRSALGKGTGKMAKYRWGPDLGSSSP